MPLSKEHFKISLAAAGTTIKGFARIHGVSDTYLHLILQGKRSSKNKKLERAMKQFIDVQFDRLKFVKPFKIAA